MSKSANVCDYNNHNLDLTHVCIYKECKNDRIACMRCLNDIHDH